MGPQALRLPATLDTECASVDQLGQATPEAFAQHPDYQIITSFTGLGDTTGARVLAEIGDDRTRFADCPRSRPTPAPPPSPGRRGGACRSPTSE